jgi:hypothetical protein
LIMFGSLGKLELIVVVFVIALKARTREETT